jgi:hypothetical protein
MPIRTNRGRAAVYRRLWGWPMRSPRHLAILVFVVAILVIAAGILIPQLTGSDDKAQGAAVETTGSKSTTAPSAPSTNSPGATGGATSSLPTRITSPPSNPTSAPPAKGALDVAEEWGKAWVTHPEGMTAEQWLASMQPFTTEEQLTEMSTVDPRNITATKVTGDPESVESYTSSVKVKLPTDDGDLLITVIKTPDGWRVNFYDQADR